ncbi:MAG: metallophosphoesterase [Clostridiales bacterium]|jgi:hypothetical protein|nr:metallophosphoesterase [Clostridiales bacterium]
MKVVKRVFLVLLTVLAIVNPLLSFGVFALGYPQIDNEIFTGFSYLLLILMGVNAAFMLFCLFFYKKDRRIAIPIRIVIGFSTLLSVFFTLINYVTATRAVPEATRFLVIGMLPIFAAVFGSLFALFALPSFKVKARKVVAAVLFAAVVLTCSAYLFKLVPFKFELATDPLVLDIGTGYSVAWGTNAEAVAYLTYESGGEEKTVWSSIEGTKRVGVIHSVFLPYDEFKDADYSIHAVRSHGTLPYGSHLGKAVDSQSFHFSDDRTKLGVNIASFSDWHNLGYLLPETASRMGKLDLILMLGDFSDYYVSESMIVSNVIKDMATATKSSIPAILVKGNHEARADGLYDVWSQLGLSKNYYQVERNGILFTVLDSGEAVSDEYYEHGGMNDFERYDKEQLEWYKSLPLRTDVFNALLCHTTHGFLPYFGGEFRAETERLQMQFVVGGHTGHSRVIAYDKFYNFEEGGWETDGNAVEPLDFVTGAKKINLENLRRVFLKNYYYFIGGQILIPADRSTITFKILRNDSPTELLNKTVTAIYPIV